MGSFYVQVMVLDVPLEQIRPHVAGPAFLASSGPAVFVFAESDDEGDSSAEALTSSLACRALTVGVHDSDVLSYDVHDGGQRVAGGVVPDPAEYFGGEADEAYEAPDAAALVRALGRGDVTAVAAALSSEFVFAEERHAALLEALDLPGIGSWGYRYLDDDPASYDGPQLHRV